MLDSKKVKEKLTTEDVIKLFCSLQGSDDVLYDAQGHPIFCTSICHGGDSDKLYYYPETGLTHCYTCGRSADVFEIVQSALGVGFREALDYVVKFFGIRELGFDSQSTPELTDDWDIFRRIQDYDEGNEDNTESGEQALGDIPENLLEYFYPLAAPQEWQKDGISIDVMRAYGIRIDTALQKIISAHRDVNGKLAGIRGRSYDPRDLESGKKYMPVFIEKTIYNHPLGKNLYGLYNNKDVIARTRKAYVAEGEKSVLQLATMYGLDNCFAVATCGSSFSKEQMKLLLDLGVNEIILGFDREFEGGRGAPDTVEYEQKLLKIVSPLLPYVNVSVIMDYDHILPQKKMSPTDAGKEIFEKLYHQRVRLSSYNERIARSRKEKK